MVIIVAIASMVRIPDTTIASIAIAKVQGAITGLDGDAARNAFVRLAMIGEGRRGEEQGRRKGKRS